MKKQAIKGLAFIAVAGSMATSCDQLKDLNYTVTPSPLEMHGDSVRVKVEVQVPEKGIKKKASAEITPMLGESALKSVTIQGEKVTGNGNVIQYKPGGKVVYEDVIAYKPEFENADLKVTGKIKKGTKAKGDLPEKKIADATIITPLLVNKDFKVIFDKDAFKRVTEEKAVAVMHFEKGKSNVRQPELKDSDIKMLESWMKIAETNPKIDVKSVQLQGFASPEGEQGKNENLSTDRATAAKDAIKLVAKKSKHTEIQTEEVHVVKGNGEDWDGFKAELEASNMNEDEKNLVLRVLSTFEGDQRDQEIQNMAKSFQYLEKNVLPKLRRAEISVVYDLTGYSDEELKALSVSAPDSLKLEELLFTATLTNDLNEKERIYKICVKNFGNDYRVHNNLGSVYYMQNKMSEAKSCFEKANSLKDNAISKNNLAAIAGTSGDRKKAAELLKQANGAGNEVKYNQGILDIQDGKYDAAISNFGGEASFNKALAQLLAGNSEAVKTLNASKDKETAQGYYLKAIAAARGNSVEETANNLKSAISKDASYKAKAAKDREFLKFADNAAFTSVIQ